MDRLWVIEATFRSGAIEICDFAERPFAFTNFYKAHQMKREIQKYLSFYDWEKQNIRVREYKRS